MKLVGSDIQPGTYRTRERAPGCYWTRLAGLSGELGDIIANGHETGPAIITIAQGDKAFESKRCGLWSPDLSAVTTAPTQPFEDGTYLVGVDVAPGTWRSDSPDGCYWVRLKSFAGGMAGIIANAHGRGLVTIAPTDKGFQSHRCGTWTRVSP